MRVISFSIWGEDHSFLAGAVQNAIEAHYYYPDWELWLYASEDAHVFSRPEIKDYFKIWRRPVVASQWEGLFWRFEPAFHPDVEVFISRDCDSRLNPREATAVNEWLVTGKRLHTMRDHYEHIVPILGGMWGCRHWPEFKELMHAWTRRNHKGSDQDFLKDRIWPLVRDHDSVAHDLYTENTTIQTPNGPFTYRPVEFFGLHDIRRFPEHRPLIPALHGEHVGARV